MALVTSISSALPFRRLDGPQTLAAFFMAFHLRNLRASPSVQRSQHASLAHLLEKFFWKAITHALVRCSVDKCSALDLVSAYAGTKSRDYKIHALFDNPLYGLYAQVVQDSGCLRGRGSDSPHPNWSNDCFLEVAGSSDCCVPIMFFC